MKNFKRKLAGFLVFAMVLGIMAPGVVAQAAETEEVEVKAVTISYMEERADFNLPSSAASIQYTDATEDKIESGKAVWESVDNVENGHGTMDLSWVKKNKDVVITYKSFSAQGDPVTNGTIELKAQSPKKLKVALIATATGSGVGKDKLTVKEGEAIGDPETGFIVVYDATSKDIVSPATIQWKKGATGQWAPVSYMYGQGGVMQEVLKNTLPSLKAKGATLYFREVVDETKAWPTKEVKFSYKKQANAPKAKVDVSKLTIGLKGGQEYQVAYKGESWPDEWINLKDDMELDAKTNAADIKKLSIPKLWTESAEPGSGTAIDLGRFYDGTPLKIRIRTAANSEKGTIPSKIYSFTVKAATMAGISEAGIKLGYNTEKDAYMITNTDEKSNYEYALVASNGAITTPEKWTKIAAKKTGSDAKTISITGSKTEGKDLLLIRKAGVKANAKKGIEEFVAGEFFVEELKDIKTEGATTLSGASVKGLADVTAVVDGFTVNVSGTAVSGAATKLEVTLDMKNLSPSVTKATAESTVGDAKVTVPTTLNNGSVTLTIELEAGKTLAGKTLEVKFGAKTSVKLNLTISAPAASAS